MTLTLHSRSEHKALTVYGKTPQCTRGSEAGGGVIQNEMVCIPLKERVALVWTRLYLPLCLNVTQRETGNVRTGRGSGKAPQLLQLLSTPMTNLGAKPLNISFQLGCMIYWCYGKITRPKPQNTSNPTVPYNKRIYYHASDAVFKACIICVHVPLT